MDRFLAAFERPVVEVLSSDDVLAVEDAWNRWVERLNDYHLQLPGDLDPVATVGSIEVYEVTRL